MAVIEVETLNSVYLLDEDNEVYRRTPGALRHVPSLRLEYGIDHPLKKFAFHPTGCTFASQGHLHLWEETSTLGICTSEVLSVAVR